MTDLCEEACKFKIACVELAVQKNSNIINNYSLNTVCLFRDEIMPLSQVLRNQGKGLA
jgi:hypothetical protein